MVAGGTLLSAFWILAANSWMQTPAGFELVNGRFFPKDWLQIIFNPSFPYRLAHMVVASYITTALVVLGVAAFYLRRDRFVSESRLMMSMALGLLTILVPLQVLIGDLHGRNTLEYQPAKLAAIEARWTTASHVPLTLFALPDRQTATNRYALDVPDLGSLILTHDRNGTVRGLEDWPRSEWPPVALPFFTFRIMVGIAVLMLILVVASWWLRARGYRLPLTQRRPPSRRSRKRKRFKKSRYSIKAPMIDFFAVTVPSSPDTYIERMRCVS